MPLSLRWRRKGIPISRDPRAYFVDEPEAAIQSERRSIGAAYLVGLCTAVYVVPLVHDIYRSWHSIAVSYPGIFFVGVYLAPLLVVVIGHRIPQITYSYAVILCVLLALGLGHHSLAFLASLLMLLLGAVSALFLVVLAAQYLEITVAKAWKRRGSSDADVSGP